MSQGKRQNATECDTFRHFFQFVDCCLLVRTGAIPGNDGSTADLTGGGGFKLETFVFSGMGKIEMREWRGAVLISANLDRVGAVKTLLWCKLPTVDTWLSPRTELGHSGLAE
jgi:hypothetical protein